MSTVADELAATEKEMARWAAQIGGGNISIDSLNRLAVARGERLALGILAMDWDGSDRRRRASAERNIVEAKGKLHEPGAASIMAKAEIAVYARYLSGDLTIG